MSRSRYINWESTYKIITLSGSEKKKLLGCQISSILTLYNISVENHSETNDIDILSIVKIAGNSPVLIPANSMKVLTCTTRQRNDRCKKYYAMVQAIQGNKGNNKITELRTILQRESPNS